MKKWQVFFKKPVMTCTGCERKIIEGERFIMEANLPKEREMLVGRFDVVCTRTAQHIWCETCINKKENTL